METVIMKVLSVMAIMTVEITVTKEDVCSAGEDTHTDKVD
jgi:hypothetical protein